MTSKKWHGPWCEDSVRTTSTNSNLWIDVKRSHLLHGLLSDFRQHVLNFLNVGRRVSVTILILAEIEEHHSTKTNAYAESLAI